MERKIGFARRWPGRLAAIAIPAVLALVGGYAWSGASDEPPLSGSMREFKPAGTRMPAPSAVFSDSAGRAVDLADLKGKIVILNVWATWCAPCVREMPSLEQLAKGLDPATVTLLAVSEDIQGATVVDPFLANHGLKGLAIDLDPKNVLLRAFRLRGLPTTLILDAEGRELGRLEGGTDWSTPEARALIDFYVRGPRNPGLPATSRT